MPSVTTRPADGGTGIAPAIGCSTSRSNMGAITTWLVRRCNRASSAAYPQPSKVSGAPFRSSSPRRDSSMSARWNPSIGTTTAPHVAARNAASVDFPAPGEPVIPSRKRVRLATTRGASSCPSGERRMTWAGTAPR